MGQKTKISWCDSTWNPVTGCTKVSAGCLHCYAIRFMERWRGIKGHHFENGADVTLRYDKLDEPRGWKKPRRIFVCSMADLFHDQVPFEYILAVLARCVTYSQHTYLILTKRPERAAEFFKWMESRDGYKVEMRDNIWFGVTVENKAALSRVTTLVSLPVAKRFVSCEPLLESVSFRWADWEPMRERDHLDGLRRLDWVIVGGESGPGARPMNPNLARGIQAECAEAGIPFFMKQLGGVHDKRDQLEDLPDDLRIREMPNF